MSIEFPANIMGKEYVLKSNDSLHFLNTIANEQANTHNFDILMDPITQQLKSITNAIFVTFSEYQSTEKIMKNKKIVANKTILDTAIKIAGEKILNSEILVDNKMYLDIVAERIKTFSTLYECTHGGIEEKISLLIQKALKIDKFYSLSYIIDT